MPGGAIRRPHLPRLFWDLAQNLRGEYMNKIQFNQDVIGVNLDCLDGA